MPHFLRRSRICWKWSMFCEAHNKQNTWEYGMCMGCNQQRSATDSARTRSRSGDSKNYCVWDFDPVSWHETCVAKFVPWLLPPETTEHHTAVINDLIQTATNKPDLASCYFWLFQKLKSPLKGKKFQIINQIQKNRMGQLMVIPTEDFAECFEQWKRRWENSVRSQGACFERDWSIIVLCTLFLVSCVFFNKRFYFSCYVAGYFMDMSPKLNRYFGNIKVNWRTIIILERGWCLEQVGLNRPLRYG